MFIPVELVVCIVQSGGLTPSQRRKLVQALRLTRRAYASLHTLIPALWSDSLQPFDIADLIDGSAPHQPWVFGASASKYGRDSVSGIGGCHVRTIVRRFAAAWAFNPSLCPKELQLDLEGSISHVKDQLCWKPLRTEKTKVRLLDALIVAKFKVAVVVHVTSVKYTSGKSTVRTLLTGLPAGISSLIVRERAVQRRVPVCMVLSLPESLMVYPSLTCLSGPFGTPVAMELVRSACPALRTFTVFTETRGAIVPTTAVMDKVTVSGDAHVTFLANNDEPSLTVDTFTVKSRYLTQLRVVTNGPRSTPLVVCKTAEFVNVPVTPVELSINTDDVIDADRVVVTCNYRGKRTLTYPGAMGLARMFCVQSIGSLRLDRVVLGGGALDHLAAALPNLASLEIVYCRGAGPAGGAAVTVLQSIPKSVTSFTLEAAEEQQVVVDVYDFEGHSKLASCSVLLERGAAASVASNLNGSAAQWPANFADLERLQLKGIRVTLDDSCVPLKLKYLELCNAAIEQISGSPIEFLGTTRVHLQEHVWASTVQMFEAAGPATRFTCDNLAVAAVCLAVASNVDMMSARKIRTALFACADAAMLAYVRLLDIVVSGATVQSSDLDDVCPVFVDVLQKHYPAAAFADIDLPALQQEELSKRVFSLQTRLAFASVVVTRRSVDERSAVDCLVKRTLF